MYKRIGAEMDIQMDKLGLSWNKQKFFITLSITKRSMILNIPTFP